MCMGKTHARQGVPAGIALATFGAPLVGAPLPLSLGVAVAGLIIGAAVFPDIDHPDATVAHTFGPASTIVSKAVHGVSGTLYSLTRTKYDRDRDGGHRGITHTALFAAGTGVLTWWLVHLFWLWAVGATLFVFGNYAVRALAGKWAYRHPFLALAVATWCAGVLTLFLWAGSPPELTARWFGIAVAAGCVTHMVGDCMTTQGCPVFFPVPIRGQVWRMVGTPRFLRFDTETNSRAESALGRLSLGTGAMVAAAFLFTLIR
jgi:membrane-bound metal-dependent hydrolase YbcI (DUF457 family)